MSIKQPIAGVAATFRRIPGYTELIEGMASKDDFSDSEDWDDETGIMAPNDYPIPAWLVDAVAEVEAEELASGSGK